MANLALMHQPAIILNGASQSAVLDVTERVIVAIALPATWTAASITFLAADTAEGTFQPVYDAAGVEYTVVAVQGHVVVVPADATRAFRYVKLRSGTGGTPVNQGGDRSLSVATVNDIAS